MKNVKNIISNRGFKVLAACMTFLSGIMTAVPCSATEQEIIDEIEKPTSFITNILLAAVAAGGVIVLIKGLFFDLIPAIQSHEGLKAILTGLAETVFGVLMISASAILNAWGWL